MRKLVNLSLAFVLVGSTQAVTQERLSELEAAVKQRIDRLTQDARARGLDRADEARYSAGRDAAARSIQREVDEFVSAALEARSFNVSEVRRSLQSVLASHRTDPEYGGPPYAQFVETANGPGLIVGFSAVGRSHDDIPSIRGYNGTLGRFVLAANTGDDLVGHTIFVTELPAPVGNEAWVLVTARAQSFNGTKIRFRAYAFDGLRFRTIWRPDDMLDAQLTKTDFGFSVRHLRKDRLPWTFVQDDYVLTFDGFSKRGL